ncbi:hypothetical protein LCGC14_3028310, partial [marine sediment metagenome]
MKKCAIDIALENLKGFARKGARAKNKDFIPTGHFNLDFAIRYGMLPNKVDMNNLRGYDPSKSLGLPTGRLIEIFGPEGGGKSSLCYRVVGYAQKIINQDTQEPNIAAWIDTEHSFEEELAELNGVNIDELIYSELYDENDPDKDYYAEDVIDMIVKALKSGVKVVVIDSVANLIPKGVFESDAEKENIAKLARILSKTLGKVGHFASKYNAMVIFVNQVREKPGIMFGSPETTPGGRALKFNASVRLRISKQSSKDSLIYIDDKNIDGGKRIIGRLSNVKIAKNRIGPPLIDPAKGSHIAVEIPIYYQPYFPNIEDILFDIGRQLKLIFVRNGVFSWRKEKI